MPIADIVIAVAVVISIIVGFARGFVKEAVSIASLLLAIWAAFNIGPHAASISADCRGIVLVAVFIIGGQYASFDQDNWWRESRFIPYVSQVSDWLRVMAPKGMEMLQPPENPTGLPVDVSRIMKQEA